MEEQIKNQEYETAKQKYLVRYQNWKTSVAMVTVCLVAVFIGIVSFGVFLYTQ